MSDLGLQPWAWMVSIAAAVTVAAGLFVTLLPILGWRSRARRVNRRSGELPVWFTWAARLDGTVPKLLAAGLPGPLRGGLQRALARAGFAAECSVEQWFAGSLLWALASLLLSAVLVQSLGSTGLVAALPAVLPWTVLRDRMRQRERRVLRDLPFCLDALALALESGCTLTTGLQAVSDFLPKGPLGDALLRLQGELRAGRTRRDGLRQLDETLGTPPITALCAALIQAESSGGSLGPLLRAQSTARSEERFVHAEKLAMQAPVKLLGPLVICIFPGTFLILGFTIAMKLSAVTS